MTAPAPDGAGDDDVARLVSAGWRPGADGLHVRHGARVVLLDADDRLLLLRAHDPGEPSRDWWFTVGGGVDPGEDPRAAAMREAEEEVGLRLDRSALVGPVWRRSAVFDFARVHCRQHEEFFVARIDAALVSIDRSRWTAIEQDTVDEVRWWSVEELATCRTQVYPEGLAALVRGLLDGPGGALGWDGTTVVLPEQR